MQPHGPHYLSQRMFVSLIVLLCLFALTSALVRVGSVVKGSRRLHLASQSNDHILSQGDLAKNSVKKALSSSLLALGGLMLSTQRANAAPKYLKEPTAEFQAEEAKVRAYQAAQKKVRDEWDAIMARFTGTEESSELAKALRDMKDFISKNNDIPVGVSKRDLVKICRTKKLVDPKARIKKIKPFWTTPVEIEYQALIQEFNRKQNPVNEEKGV